MLPIVAKVEQLFNAAITTLKSQNTRTSSETEKFCWMLFRYTSNFHQQGGYELWTRDTTIIKTKNPNQNPARCMAGMGGGLGVAPWAWAMVYLYDELIAPYGEPKSQSSNERRRMYSELMPALARLRDLADPYITRAASPFQNHR